MEGIVLRDLSEQSHRLITHHVVAFLYSVNLQLLSKFLQRPRAALLMLDWLPQWSVVFDLPYDLPCSLCPQDADCSMKVIPRLH